MEDSTQALSSTSNLAVENVLGEVVGTEANVDILESEDTPGHIGDTEVSVDQSIFELEKKKETDSTPCRPHKRARFSTGGHGKGTLLPEVAGEAELKRERIRQIIDEDASLAILRKKEFQINVEIAERRKEHMLELFSLDLRAARAKAELAELELELMKKKVNE